MEEIQGYALKTETDLSYEEAISKVTNLLKDEGFGILSEIDVKATLKKKIDVDYKPYIILGACNPPFAHKALNAVETVGVLMPCNVVVWDDGDKRIIAAMEPKIMAKVIDNEELSIVAATVSEKMHRVISKV
jgi:uncharacterized protein (DUF302 family)